MSEKIQAIRGMNDTLPSEMPVWHRLEQVLRNVSFMYGYKEIRFPIVEKTKLFKRAVGEVTDIVEKEMYTFADRNDDLLSLRPEGTAGCVRASIEHGLLYNQTQRLWYLGPMFRHERPQKGRYRQFYQFGLEAFGFSGVEIELEQLLLTHRLFTQLGLVDQLTLQVNTIGNLDDRAKFRSALVEFLMKHQDELDEDSKRRLLTNPLRILDSKCEKTQAILQQAPTLMDYLSAESRLHFESFVAGLDALSIHYEVNPKLVRGLDYYSHAVFEWVTASSRAQNTVCAGGRYDALVEQLGGKPSFAVGFALGLERVVDLMLTHDDVVVAPNCYLISINQNRISIYQLREKLLAVLPSMSILCDMVGGNLKKQLKRADKSNSRLVVFVEDDILKMKDLQTGEENNCTFDELVSVLSSN